MGDQMMSDSSLEDNQVGEQLARSIWGVHGRTASAVKRVNAMAAPPKVPIPFNDQDQYT